jgi:hypothetical protein
MLHRKKIAVALSVFAALLATAVFSPAAEALHIANLTGWNIHAIYVSDSESDDWGENLIGDGMMLPNKKGIDVEIYASTFDIRYENEDGDGWEIPEIRGNALSVTLFPEIEYTMVQYP